MLFVPRIGTKKNRNKAKKTNGCEEEECDHERFYEEESPQSQRQAVSPRMTGLYGDLNEKMAATVIQSLLLLHHSGQKKDMEEIFINAMSEEEMDELEDDDEIDEDKMSGMIVFRPIIKTSPIEFMISTYGGSLDEMFSVYDVMRTIQKDTEIYTIGMGKVCSAGILLLAAGTKGKRFVGENCRLMIHEMSSVHHGDVDELEAQMEDLQNMKKRYHNSLVKETNITPKQLAKILKKGDFWLDAEEAVELGIADKVI